MKISKIAALCKKTKSIVHVHGEEFEGTQWIGTGNALYRVDGMPEFSQESLLALFDVPEDKRSEWMYRAAAPGVDLRDYVPEDESIEPVGFPVQYHGGTLQMYSPLRSMGAAYLNTVYLAPLLDEAGKLTMFWRGTGSGQCFAIKSGLFLRAILFPSPVASHSLADGLRSMAELTTRMVCRQEAAEPGYQQQQINPETGEIVEETEGDEGHDE